jgi:hypothetical protein
MYKIKNINKIMMMDGLLNNKNKDILVKII